MERKKLDHSLWHWAYRLCLTACFLVALHSFALAGEATPDTKKRSEGTAFQVSNKSPIFITSDRMELDQKQTRITYTGRVVAVRGEMMIKSETLTAYYSPEMKGIREIIAEGSVHITQGNRVATGTKAVFNGRNQTITLTGSPVVCQGNNQVSGSRITFFIEKDRAVVEGGPQRVKATIFPEELQKQEKGKGPPHCKRDERS